MLWKKHHRNQVYNLFSVSGDAVVIEDCLENDKSGKSISHQAF